MSVPRSPPEPFTYITRVVLAGGGIDRVDLGRGVAAGVVGVAAVAAEPVTAVEQLRDRPGGADVGGAHDPHPDAPFRPRSAVMRSA